MPALHRGAIVRHAPEDETDTKTARIGDKTRITAGSNMSGGVGERFNPVRLRVESLTHLSDKCSIHE